MTMLRVTGASTGAPIDYTSQFGRGERRRVLMTVDAVGGVWRYAMELARGLVAHNVELVFAGLGPEPSADQTTEAERLGKVVWLDEPLDWIAPNPAALKNLPKRLCRLAADEGAELLHLNLPSQAAEIEAGVPVLVTSHSCVVTWWNAMRSGPLPESWEWMKRQNADGMKRADAVVAPSGSHAQALASCYGEQPRINVVNNSLSAFLQGLEKEPFIFAAGRWWDEGKNARVLDEAAAEASWPVLMAGATEGPNGQSINLAHARHLGQVPHTQILDHARRADIVVSPSIYEPFGLAALEGARAGAALVLSDIPTYRELWSEVAFFFDPNDPQALAEVVNRLAEDAELRTEMGARALARSRRFTPDVQAGRMAALYRQLVETADAGAA
ncbi:glycosyltransferase family 4 protein [Chelativorans sp. YIM 93263]|uniref:glycosyltransferase family 4 protein n=1 Tax=Chelativorans sp. YIM 93263 TaxID=2906648 RepID=UPI0023795A95|nr:glycosyltransferase family 4 protein [Chelativorans sp. YIM 93263]